MIELLLCIGIPLTIAVVILTITLYSHFKLTRDKWKNEILDQLIENAVMSLMGAAKKMKLASPDKKLNETARSGLSNHAATIALRSYMGIFNDKADVTAEDLECRIKVAVIKAKMNWSACGLTALEEQKLMADMAFEVFKKIDPNDTGQEKWE